MGHELSGTNQIDDLGDPEFDAAFEIRGESVEDITNFLEPNVRTALLVGLPKLQKARLKEENIETNQVYATPLSLTKDMENSLERFSLMALALKGEGEWAKQSIDGDVIKKKLRKFAFGCPCLVSPLWQPWNLRAPTG